MVLVSHDHEFIFLKTTKTGSSSVEMALQPLCQPPGSDVVERTHERVSRHGIVGARNARATVADVRHKWRVWRPYDWINHMSARAVRRNLGARRFDGYRKITAVRNPFNRAVSAFHYISRNRGLDLPEETGALKSAFRDFVTSNAYFNDLPIVSVDGRLVVDVFIRLEHIDEDLADLARSLNVDASDLRIPHTKNFASLRMGRHPAEYYDRITIDHVRTSMRWVWDNVDYPDTPDGTAEPDPPPAQTFDPAGTTPPVSEEKAL